MSNSKKLNGIQKQSGPLEMFFGCRPQGPLQLRYGINRLGITGPNIPVLFRKISPVTDTVNNYLLIAGLKTGSSLLKRRIQSFFESISM